MLRTHLLFLLLPLAAHAESLSGALTGSDNQPIQSATITAIGTAKVPWTSTGTTSAKDGSFTFPNLPPGPYRLCVHVPAGGYLDPCSWSPAPPTVTLAAGKSTAGFQLKIAAGSVLKVRLDDPTNLTKTATNTPPPVLMGVHTPNALFVPFVMRASDKNGSDHEVTIPFDQPVKVSIQSGKVSLAKSDGTPVAAGATISVTQSSAPGPPPAVLTIQVTGAKP